MPVKYFLFATLQRHHNQIVSKTTVLHWPVLHFKANMVGVEIEDRGT